GLQPPPCVRATFCSTKHVSGDRSARGLAAVAWHPVASEPPCRASGRRRPHRSPLRCRCLATPHPLPLKIPDRDGSRGTRVEAARGSSIPPRWINHSAHGFVSDNVSDTNCTFQLVLLSVSNGLMFESGAAMHGVTVTQRARSLDMFCTCK